MKKGGTTMNKKDAILWNKVYGSSQIKEECYQEENKRLFLKFSNGSVYSYEGVDSDMYSEFKNAASAGAYFHENIKQLVTTKVKNKNG